MLRKLGFTLASCFLIYQTFTLVPQLARLANSLHVTHWGNDIFIACIINLFITGVFAFAGFAWPTESLLPSAYYKVQSPVRLKRWFRALRVEYFRQFLLYTVWRNKKNQRGYFDGTVNGLEILSDNSKKSEFGHLIPFILITLLSVYLLLHQRWNIAFCVLLINIFFNFYPILLQRHHRMRIDLMNKRNLGHFRKHVLTT